MRFGINFFEDQSSFKVVCDGWMNVMYLSVTTPVFGCSAASVSQSDSGTALTHQESDASVSHSPI